VSFDGHPQVRQVIARANAQHRAVETARLVRGKNAYSREAFEEDRQRILTYYENHGFPERESAARESLSSLNLHAAGFPGRMSRGSGLSVSIPIEAGPFTVSNPSPLQKLFSKPRRSTAGHHHYF